MAADEVALRGLNGGLLDVKRHGCRLSLPGQRWVRRRRVERLLSGNTTRKAKSALVDIAPPSRDRNRPSLCENSATEEFWGSLDPLTLGEVEKIAPSAIWRLDISSHSTRNGFSHSLGR